MRCTKYSNEISLNPIKTWTRDIVLKYFEAWLDMLSVYSIKTVDSLPAEWYFRGLEREAIAANDLITEENRHAGGIKVRAYENDPQVYADVMDRRGLFDKGDGWNRQEWIKEKEEEGSLEYVFGDFKKSQGSGINFAWADFCGHATQEAIDVARAKSLPNSVVFMTCKATRRNIRDELLPPLMRGNARKYRDNIRDASAQSFLENGWQEFFAMRYQAAKQPMWIFGYANSVKMAKKFKKLGEKFQNETVNEDTMKIIEASLTAF